MQEMTPFIGVISQIVCWVFFLIAFAMCKGFIATGISIAFAEILPKIKIEHQEKLVRWMSDSDEIMEHLKELKEKK